VDLPLWSEFCPVIVVVQAAPLVIKHKPKQGGGGDGTLNSKYFCGKQLEQKRFYKRGPPGGIRLL